MDDTDAPSEDALAPDVDGPRTIHDALGTVELEGTPKRIVALEWTYAEDLLALGVQPVGVADVEGYGKWVNLTPGLSDDVVDVGTRQEPSLEKIAELEPDLIIGVKFRHESIRETLTSIAPTLIYSPYPSEDGPTQFTEMRETFLSISKAVDREEKGHEVLADMDARLDALKADVAALDLEHQDFVIAQAFTWKDSPTLRLLTENALASTAATRLGLTNAWDDGFQTYGFSTVNLEALESVEQANFFYVVQDDDNVFEDEWNDHPVWTNLTFVQEERAYPLGGDAWLFGGPLSTLRVAEKMVDALDA